MRRQLSIVFSLLMTTAIARAQDFIPGGGEGETPKPPPAPYSLPWALRPAAVANVVRSDTVLASYEDAKGNAGDTLLSTLLVSFKVNDRFAPLVRVGFVDNSPPVGKDGSGYVNPVVGGTYLIKPRPDLRVALFLGLTIPTGQGGGNAPNPATKAAVASGVLARSAMDNAMFAINDFTVFPGVGIAYVKSNATLQWEATVLQLTRVKGDKVQKDKAKTNFTTGLHFGYYFGKRLSLGTEIRYQRWLSTPSFVDANETLRDNLSVAAGPRFHLKAGKKVWLRPGISYATGLHGPIDDLGYGIVQIDLPIYF